MKQTSVEWLINEIDMQYPEINVRRKEWMVDQAKEMEKQQIVDAFGVGCQVESTRLIGYHKMAEQYYNETYGK